MKPRQWKYTSTHDDREEEEEEEVEDPGLALFQSRPVDTVDQCSPIGGLVPKHVKEGMYSHARSDAVVMTTSLQ